MMTRLHPDDIQAIAQQVASLLGVVPTMRPQGISPGQHAIDLAKAGKIEESKKFLKGLSKRRSQ